MTDCNCQACQDLKAECGSNFVWMRLKLLQKGWAGQRSPAEKAYQKAHGKGAAKGLASEAKLKAMARFMEAAAKRRSRSDHA